MNRQLLGRRGLRVSGLSLGAITFGDGGWGARWHAVAEEGVPARGIAEAIGFGLRVPVKSLSPDEAADYFGWLGLFAQMDMPASSDFTRRRLGWEPNGPSLIQDLREMDYSSVEAR